MSYPEGNNDYAGFDSYDIMEFISDSFGSKKPGPKKPQAQGIDAVKSLAKRLQLYDKYISFNKPFFASNEKIKKKNEAALQILKKFINNIQEELTTLLDKKNNVEQQKFLNSHSTSKQPITQRYVTQAYYEGKLQLIFHREKLFKVIESRLNAISSFIQNRLGSIAPDVEVSIYTSTIKNDINLIKKSPQYLSMKKHTKCLKFKIQYLKVNISPITYFDRALSSLNTEAPIDDGIALTNFQKGINLMPNEYRESLLNRSRDCTVDPPKCGDIILAESKKLQERTQKSDLIVTSLFYLFTRHIFSLMYYTQLNYAILQQDISFLIERIQKMSNLPPIIFGQLTKFVSNSICYKPISEILQSDIKNSLKEYEQGITYLEIMKFQTCPIDFCSLYYSAISLFQTAASSFAYQQAIAQGKNVSDQSDKSLGVDDLSDVTFIFLLYINPIEIIRLVETFEPYIEGLQMTSELLFAFTNLKTLCEIITKTDIDKFIRDAIQKMKKELKTQTDPNIIQSIKNILIKFNINEDNLVEEENIDDRSNNQHDIVQNNSANEEPLQDENNRVNNNNHEEIIQNENNNVNEEIIQNENNNVNEEIIQDENINVNEEIIQNENNNTGENEEIIQNENINVNEEIIQNENINVNEEIIQNEDNNANKEIIQDENNNAQENEEIIQNENNEEEEEKVQNEYENDENNTFGIPANWF